MKNKIISAVFSVVLAFSAVAAFAGCSGNEYPVEVANIKIESEPKNIVVLDDSAADIISYIGYDVKMVGRSDEVNQQWLSVAPSVGSSSSPDVNKIKESRADIVFAGENLDKNVKESLEKENIKVITMSQPKTEKQLETNYRTLGKILGGKVTGAKKGEDSYKELIEKMEQTKASVTGKLNSDVLYTVCYLYVENNSLKLMTSGTYGDMLLGYTGAVNAAVNIDENKVDVNTLKIANPNFIFYADDATLNAIKSDGILSKLSAIKNGKVLKITYEDMNRQGRTALETLDKMIKFMYPSLNKDANSSNAASPDTANAAQTAATVNSTQPTTVPASTAAGSTSLADKYKIKLDKLSLKPEDENGNVKIMQQRLYDLGYITDKENVTGYYGEVSQTAVKEFQSKNGIKVTGTADNATLVKLFDSNAVNKA